MFSAPACLVLLAVGNFFIRSPQILPAAIKWWHILLPNALLAFALNVTVALVIKECSAVGFVLTGIIKDIIIVFASCVIFGDLLKRMQIFSFAITIFGIFIWSYMKTFPEDPAVRKFELALGYKP